MSFYIDKVAKYFKNHQNTYFGDLSEWNNHVLNYCYENDPIVKKIIQLIEVQIHIEDTLKKR